ncbi:molecular chaperone DnaJ [Nostocaceae cyanobacterium CENA369]|uniref:Molecular chaperone DnaJ n=1 Tax=Dendronalium phyllosphericum CENA369 TaxID=1725256 RepID=A0A8J7IMJ1_9NOST|nr:J domain-containing protein [Dendronalium phyllosphericum]MBH8576827.1 molecular chaperone DnaJ [Dendronalium phyllosphericum CENA369]
MPRSGSSTSQSKPAKSLALSSFHIRLEVLEKEHQWLLKQIKRKRTELKNFVEQMRSLATDIFHQCNPSFQKIVDIDREIHTLFDEIFSTRKFGKQTQKDVEGIYHSLQLAGIISPKLEKEDADAELDELFETEEKENDFSEEETGKDYQEREAQQEIESPVVNKNDSSRKIRQTFLRLAEIFHPDKVTDGETQMRHTEIMKEINKAYQEGDFARLLEIERQHQVGENINLNNEDDLTRQCNRLEQENEFLKNQYETLKRELRLVKNTPEGEMVSDCRKAAKEGIDPMEQMLKQVEAQIQVISSIRDFVRDFREQKITIKEFLRGPEVLRSLNREIMEDLLEQMFEELGAIVRF